MLRRIPTHKSHHERNKGSRARLYTPNQIYLFIMAKRFKLQPGTKCRKHAILPSFDVRVVNG